jgi:hypothetical protein
LPEAFGRRVAIFVDTEEEFDWSKPHRREERSTTAAESIPLIQHRLRSYGSKPIYLIDHPIATDPRCVATLREYLERDECTVGTQLHPWVNPPFEEELTVRNSYPGNLPLALERAKLERLTDEIEKSFGRRPIIYRAGRYGVGPNTAELLKELGYKIDVSVRTLFDYSGDGGPDFSTVRAFPYWIDDDGLLEVPLTSALVGALRGLGPSAFRGAGRIPRLRSLLNRTGLLGRVALTPEGMPLPEVIRAVERLLEDGVQLLSISFHSPSLQPGHTPYVRTEADLDQFYAWWDGMFDFFARRGITPVSIEEVLDAAAVAEPLRG